MPDDISIPRMPRKQIELWDITSTSVNFRPYQIQTANIHLTSQPNDEIINSENKKHSENADTSTSVTFDM